MMTTPLRTLVVAATLALPFATQAQEKPKPLKMLAYHEYVEDGKRKERPVYLDVGPEGFRFYRYGGKVQDGTVLTLGTPLTIEARQGAASGGFSMAGTTYAKGGQKAYWLVKSGDQTWLFRLADTDTAPLFAAQLEQHMKVTVVVAAAK